MPKATTILKFKEPKLNLKISIQDYHIQYYKLEKHENKTSWSRTDSTLRLNPTAKKFSGHISGHVQRPNRSPLDTVSMEVYRLDVNLVPALITIGFSTEPPWTKATRASSHRAGTWADAIFGSSDEEDAGGVVTSRLY